VKTALLSDVHGNLPALDSCLAAAGDLGCERIIVLGDVVGYWDDGLDCLSRLLALGAEMLLGNHEAMLLGDLEVDSAAEEVFRLDATRRGLSSDLRGLLSGLAPRRELALGDHRWLLVHGTPDDPLQGYAYPDTDLASFEKLPYDYVVMGNTHRAMVRRAGSVIVANVGSVGLPRDIGHRSTFGVFDDITDRFEIREVDMDVALVRATYPNAHPSVLAILERE